MTENKVEKKVINYVEPVVEYDKDNSYVTYIGAARGADTKYGVVFPIPRSDDEAKDYYGVDTLADMVELGVQKLSTMPQYKDAFNEDGTLKVNGHEEMQKMADDYKVGQRKSGTGKVAQLKAKASAAEAVAIECAARAGMSVEEVKAMIAAATAV